MRFYVAARKSDGNLYKLTAFRAIEEYFMISHCQGNAKLEYNGGFRTRLGMFTGIIIIISLFCHNTFTGPSNTKKKKKRKKKGTVKEHTTKYKATKLRTV